MAQDADELRAQIDARRSDISGTVEQIENRIRPGRIMARRRDSVRRTMTDWKDAVFGNDEPDYPNSEWYRHGPSPYASAQNGGHRPHEQGGLIERASGSASSAAEAVRGSMHDAPSMVRRQTRGNPMAAGLVAVGAGWLVASMLPSSERERAMAHRMEPALSDAATAVKHEGAELADEMREPMRDAVDEVKHAGEDAATGLSVEAKQAAGSVKESAGRSAGASPGI